MVNKNLVYSFFSKKAILFLLSSAILAFIVSLWHRYAYIDDCWFGEQAYWLEKTGYVKTETIQAGLGWEHRLFVYHKLSIWIGALIVHFAGWSIYYFKTFTLIIYFLFFIFLNYYQKTNKSWFTTDHLLLSCLLIFTNPLMFIYAFTYRPEILVMFFGFITYWTLEHSRNGVSKQFLWASLAGIASGLAFLSHLNGIIFGVSGFLFLLIYKKYRLIPVFSISAILVAVFYFIDMLQAGNLESFLQQMKNWPDAVSGNYFSGDSMIISILRKMGNEHQRFFWSPKAAAFSTLFFLSVIFSFRYLKEKYRSILIYTGLLIASLNLLGSQIAERYIIYYLPMMALIIAISVRQIIHRKQIAKLTFLVLIFVIQLGFLSKYWVEIMNMNSDFPATNHELSGYIPEGNHKLLAPYHYIYNEMGRNPLLTYQSLEKYEMAMHKLLSGHQALLRCKKLGVEYIIVDKDLADEDDKYRWFEPAINGSDPNYGVFKKHKGFIILSTLKPYLSEPPVAN